MLFMSKCWLMASFLIFFGLLLTLARSYVPKLIPGLYLYGKVRNLKEYKLRQMQFLQLPKSWFWHFYLAGIICTTVMVLSSLSNYLYSGHWPEFVKNIMHFFGYSEKYDLSSPFPVILAILMVEVQVVRRFLECILVSSYSKSTMSIAIYAAGIMFYSFIGISVLCQAQEGLINFSNVKINWNHILAVFVFIWASYKQNKVSRIFAKLRQDKNGKVNNKSHHIPHGDMFELCSCPHFFMEIVIYTSLNVLFLGQHEILLCVWIFVTLNQVIMAVYGHHWYKQTFPNYPKDRKALIPYIL